MESNVFFRCSNELHTTDLVAGLDLLNCCTFLSEGCLKPETGRILPPQLLKLIWKLWLDPFYEAIQFCPFLNGALVHQMGSNLLAWNPDETDFYEMPNQLASLIISCVGVPIMIKSAIRQVFFVTSKHAGDWDCHAKCMPRKFDLENCLHLKSES